MERVIEFIYQDKDGTKIIVSIDGDTTYEEVIQSFKQFSLAVGYQSGTIKQYLEVE